MQMDKVKLDYVIRLIKADLEFDIINRERRLDLQPFKSLTEVNEVLRPYFIKAFTVSSMQLIEFVNTGGNQDVLLTLKKTTVKNVRVLDLIQAIRGKS